MRAYLRVEGQKFAGGREQHRIVSILQTRGLIYAYGKKYMSMLDKSDAAKILHLKRDKDSVLLTYTTSFIRDYKQLGRAFERRPIILQRLVEAYGDVDNLVAELNAVSEYTLPDETFERLVKRDPVFMKRMRLYLNRRAGRGMFAMIFYVFDKAVVVDYNDMGLQSLVWAKSGGLTPQNDFSDLLLGISRTPIKHTFALIYSLLYRTTYRREDKTPARMPYILTERQSSNLTFHFGIRIDLKQMKVSVFNEVRPDVVL